MTLSAAGAAGRKNYKENATFEPGQKILRPRLLLLLNTADNRFCFHPNNNQLVYYCTP